MAIHSSILAWRIPMDRGAWQATVHGIARAGHNWVINTHTHRIINTYKQRSLYQLNQMMENTYWVREQRRPQQPEAPSSLWDYIGGQYVLLIYKWSLQTAIHNETC